MTRNIDQKGQSLVEFAIVLPILATVLLLVGFFGKACIDRQNLLIAARLGARERGIASINDPADVLMGKGVLLQANGGDADALCKQALGKLDFSSELPRWTFILPTGFLPRPVGGHAVAYLASK
ncbi:MAG TPA: hypothetical protein DD435_14205, partial [Cyanobacteria bacterium UBA8530]|nr:hypothetical protein [Cyanobacteria bacterium UBA8530]